MGFQVLVSRVVWRAMLVLTASTLALGLVSCKEPPEPRRTNFEIRGEQGIAKYDPKSGRLARIDIDQDKDGRIETFSFWDAARVLRIEVDSDNDGRIDRWEHYNGENRLSHVGSSAHDDAIEDTWTYPDERGQLARVETDTDRDGAIDQRQVFTPSADAPQTRVLSIVDLEIDRRGIPARRLYYAPDGTFQRAEVLR
jgi:hypothetical protein